MDKVKFTELDAMIKCGTFDCLKGCCDKLSLIQATLKDMTPRELALFQNMLCGCGVGGSQPNPKDTQNTCFKSVVNWVRNNKGAFNGLQALLDFAEGWVPPGPPQEMLAIFNTMLELTEDAVDNAINAPDDPTIAIKVMNAWCRMINAEYAFENYLAGLTHSDTVKNLMDALNVLNPNRFIDKKCCSGATPNAAAPTLPPGTLPMNWTPPGPSASTLGPPLGGGSPTAAPPVQVMNLPTPQPAASGPATTVPWDTATPSGPSTPWDTPTSTPAATPVIQTFVPPPVFNTPVINKPLVNPSAKQNWSPQPNTPVVPATPANPSSHGDWHPQPNTPGVVTAPVVTNQDWLNAPVK